MKHLYTEQYEGYSGPASELNARVSCALEPILQTYCNEGFAMREAGDIAHGAVNELISVMILKRNMDQKRQERNTGS